MSRGLSLYFHIPFCISKCPYCSFNSYACRDGVPEERYVSALTCELGAARSAASKVETVYIGGGTPSLLSPLSVGRIVEAVYGKFRCASDMEITLEANPGTVDGEKLAAFHSAGINRLSLGAQSFDDGVLKVLGRSHSVRDVVASFKAARRAGFGNIGIDLIFGVPGQELSSWEATLKEALKLAPEHISAYGLTYEEDTPFFRARAVGGMDSVGEEAEARIFDLTGELLAGGGYERYEISNYTVAGMESRHNMACWLGHDYLGFGAGAHSFSGGGGWGTRWWNQPEPGAFMSAVEASGSARSGLEELTKEQAATEALMTGLRLKGGIEVSSFKARFGVGPEEALERKCLAGRGLIASSQGRLFLTEKGLLLANEVY